MQCEVSCHWHRNTVDCCLLVAHSRNKGILAVRCSVAEAGWLPWQTSLVSALHSLENLGRHPEKQVVKALPGQLPILGPQK